MTDRKIHVDGARAALLLVDIQPDFMPGGRLAVPEGDHILAGVRRLATSDLFPLCVATQDWHPPGHISFASSHRNRAPFETIQLYGHDQTLWPDHCLQAAPGAELHPDLPLARISVIIRKGSDPRVDSYSGFRNNWGPGRTRSLTGLAGLLRERSVADLFVCGLARDYCVKWTAEDAVDEGFRTFVLWDLTRPVDAASDERTLQDLRDRGVDVIAADDLSP